MTVKAPVKKTLRKVKSVSKGLKSEILMLLETGLKKGEKGLSFLEKEIHKLIVKETKAVEAGKKQLKAATVKAKRIVKQSAVVKEGKKQLKAASKVVKTGKKKLKTATAKAKRKLSGKN